MDPLADVTELAARIPFVMDEDEIREATGALINLSDDARHYGNPKWLNAATCPRQVTNLVLKAAARHMKNYEGYTLSAAGDERVGFTDRGVQSGSAHFTPDEIDRLSELGGFRRTGIYSVNTFAYGQTYTKPSNAGMVPDSGSNEPIQFYNDGTPW
jgi:hypothetical protein